MSNESVLTELQFQSVHAACATDENHHTGSYSTADEHYSLGLMMIAFSAIFHMSDNIWERESLCCRVSHPATCFRMPPLNGGQTVSSGEAKHWWQAAGKAAAEENEQSMRGDMYTPTH